jgi:hypothetical protein
MVLGLPLLMLASPAGAQPAAGVNLGMMMICTEFKDNAERLQCYDKLVAESLKAPPVQTSRGAVTSEQQDWKITESKSPVDDSVQLAAVLEANEGVGALVIRCHDKISDAYINLRTYIGGVEPLQVVYRIDGSQAVDTRWVPAKSGDSVFVPGTAFFPLMRALPEDGTLFVRVFDFQSRAYDLTFKLGPVAELRDLFASKCNWPAEARAPQLASNTAPNAASAASPRPASKKLVVTPRQAQRWSVNAQRR